MGTGEYAYFCRGNGGAWFSRLGVLQKSASLGKATGEKNSLTEDIL